jgi:hypothetical protein
MYQIEKIGDDCFYVKAIGTFPLPVAERFVIEFEDLTKDIHENLNVIIDITEGICNLEKSTIRRRIQLSFRAR